MGVTYNYWVLVCLLIILFICANNVDRSHQEMPLSMDVLQLELVLCELCLVQSLCSTDNLGVGWPRTKTRILNLKKKEGNEHVLYRKDILLHY